MMLSSPEDTTMHFSLFPLISFHVLSAFIMYRFYRNAELSIFEWMIFLIGFGVSWSGICYYTIIKKWHGQSHDIWDKGPFAIVRHPFYGGMIIMLIGAAVIPFFSQISMMIRYGFVEILTCGRFVGACIVICLLIGESLRQEKKLLETFGDDARKYFKKVRARWIPFVI